MRTYAKFAALLAATIIGTVAAPALSQELKIAVTAENTTLASYETGSEVNSPGLRNVFEVLVARDPKTNQLVPELATSWEQIDPTTWEFRLREDVNYHDGSPFRLRRHDDLCQRLCGSRFLRQGGR